MIQHIRYSIRGFVRNPGFAVAAVLCLTLGIGATTAIFSVVNAVVLRPLPYAHADRLVRLYTEFPKFPNGGLRSFWLSPPEYFDVKRDTAAFEDLQGWVNGGVNLAGTSEPVRATASFVTGGLLGMLNMPPKLGRLISPEDDKPNSPLTAVLSYGLWQRGYGGDLNIVGRDIRLNGNACTVVGVMAKGFDFPPGEVNPTELWTPLQLDPVKPGGRGSHFLSVLGRLRANVNMAQAGSQMMRYVRQQATLTAPNQHGFSPDNHPLVMAGFQDEIVKTVRPAMLVLLGAVGFVLLIACVNVANLLLARAEGRRREIAVRAAMGAAIGKLLQQFVVEGLLLSLSGAVLGTLLAFGGVRLLAATNAASIPRVEEVGIDWQVLVFALALSILTGVAFGLAPLFHLKLSGLADTLKTAAGRNTSSSAANRIRSILVASELALALVLLIGAGLMVKAFWKLQEVNSGINPDKLLTMQLALPRSNYRDLAAVNTFWSSLMPRLASLPGVVSASIASGLPPSRRLNANDTTIEGFVPIPNGPIQNVDYWNFVTPNYFQTAGARLMEGRFLNDGDGAGAPLAVVINQSMARHFWPKESAIGHRVDVDFNKTWRTVVGVVADIKNAGIDQATGTELFMPIMQTSGGNRTSGAALVIRTQGDPLDMVRAVRAQIASLDRALPVSKVSSMEALMSGARARPRFLTLLLTMFSGLSLVLAALGIYGVISYGVAQRTNEIGLRMALGAQTGDVVRMVGATGLRLALIGTAVGAAGAFALTRFLKGMLFGVSSVDPLTFLAMAGALIAVTMLACYIPARRASRVDPLIALRYE